MQMKDKVAFVTGAGRGIGRAVCREMREHGAAGVVVAYLDGDMAQAMAAALGGLGLQCDVSDEAAVQAGVAGAVAHYGRIGVLLSNAGVGEEHSILGRQMATVACPDTRSGEFFCW